MSSIKKNFTYNLIYQILTLILPLVTTPYLSRVLGAEKTGIYSYSYSVANYFVLFAMLGLNNYGNREIAKVKDNIEERSIIFWSIYFLQLITGGFSTIIYIIVCLMCRNSQINWIMSLYVLSGLFDINWFFWGMEEFKITVSRNIIIKLVTVAGILLLVKSPDDLWIYAVLMAGSMLVSPLALWPYLSKRIYWIKPSLRQILLHFKPNLVLFIPVIAVSLYKIMDKIMLGWMTTYIEVGYYEYSERVIAIPNSLVNALGTVMLPRMSNLVAKNDTTQELSIIKNSVILGTGIAAAMSFGLIGIADVFVPFFYGAEYIKCVILFYVLLPSSIFISAANIVRTQYLIPHGMDKEYTQSVALGAVVNLAVNTLLIPSLQSVGAAIGTTMAEFIVCIYQFICVRKKLPVQGYIIEIFYVTVAAIVMMSVVYIIPFMGNYIITIGIKVVIGVLVFAIIMILRYVNLITQIMHK